MFSDKKKLLIALASFSVLTVIVFASLYYLTLTYSGKTLPNQSYNGLSISKLTKSELKDRFTLINNQTNQTQVLVLHEEESKTFFLQDIIQPLTEESTAFFSVQLYKSQPSILQLLSDFFQAKALNYDFALESDLNSIVLSKFPSVKLAQNAYISEDQSIIPESEGQIIDKLAFKKDLIGSFKKPLSTIQINLPLESFQPNITAQDLEPFQSKLSQIFSRSINLNSNSFNETIVLSDSIKNITLKKDDEDQSISPMFDQEFLVGLLNNKVRPNIYKEPQNLNISFDKDNNKAVFSDTTQKGQDLNIESNIEKINKSLSSIFANPNQNQNIQLELIEIAPTLVVDDYLRSRGITELIASGHTTFRGSPTNRIHNINVGMQRFNGILIPQGEEFSFNTHLGPVNASTGYRPELVIKSFGTVPEYGGGLCQVSTTMYRAALLSGLDITERSNHSYAVSYYSQVLGHGLDASIYIGVKDLRFLNNSDADILVHSYTIGNAAYFDFYGTKHIDRVELVGPVNSNFRSPGARSVTVDASLPSGTVKVLDKANTGFNSYWERLIYDKDNNLIKTEEIFSNYRAVNEKLIVSPDYYGSTTPADGGQNSSADDTSDLA